MRQLVLSPRWIIWHLLTLGAMATCGWLAAWQWGRAGSAMGSALNVGYGLQWPVFAVFFGVMWWRMLRMEAATLREAAAGAAEPAASDPDVPRPAGSTPAVELAATGAGAGPAEPAAAAADGARPGPSPFGPRPASAAVPSTDDDPELAAYNRMLAQLAAHDSHHR